MITAGVGMGSGIPPGMMPPTGQPPMGGVPFQPQQPGYFAPF